MVPQPPRFHHIIENTHTSFCVASTFPIEQKLFASGRYPTNFPPSRSSEMAVEASMDNFKFLDLPKDIRLMVYERLPAIRRHSTLSMLYNPTYNGSSTLVLTALPLAILRVSRMAYHEAYAIPKLKVYKLLSQPSRLSIPASDLFETRSSFANFFEIIRGMFSISCMVTLQFGELLYYRPGMPYYYAGNILSIIAFSFSFSGLNTPVSVS